MTDRVDLLEERVAALATAVAALEARLAGLETPAGAVARGPEDEAADGGAATADAASHGMPEVEGAAPAVLAGRAFLGIGGAFLFRALTEAGTVPHLVGVALGLAYAGAWILAAERSGRSGRRTDATLHGLLSLAVSLPLLWETTVRMQAVPPLVAAGLLTAVGVAVFVVAWRHDLASVAWAATLGAVGTAWGLLLATTRIELFTILLIAFGAATLWATYGRRWHGLRWPAALAADLSVLTLVYLGGRPGGPPEAYAGLSAGRAVFVALLLFVVYAGSFAARTLARRRDVKRRSPKRSQDRHEKASAIAGVDSRAAGTANPHPARRADELSRFKGAAATDCQVLVVNLAGKLGMIVHVYFRDLGPAAQLAGDLFQDGRLHPARSAPGRPEVHQHGQFVAGNELVEGGGAEFHRLGGQDFPAALAAFRVLVQAFGGDAVDRAAVGTDEFHTTRRRAGPSILTPSRGAARDASLGAVS